MSVVSYEEFGQLTGELLPGRVALSLVNAYFTNVNNTAYEFPAGGGGPAMPWHRVTRYSA